MIIEYSIYDISLLDIEIKNLIEQALIYKPNTICVLPPYIKIAKSIISEASLLSTVIDYPLGISETKNRSLSIESCIKSGAKIINIVAQPHLFRNRKYDKFKEDIKVNSEICIANSVELRYILEYRVFTYELLYKISQILFDLGIQTIYPSTGYQLDDINDNIIASALINKKVPINIISNGNLWHIGQINNIHKANLYGIKVNSLNALKLLAKNTHS